MRECKTCGYRYEVGDEEYDMPNYYFSSLTAPKGSYTTVQAIEVMGEDLLTCPRDEGERPPEYPAGSTPAGGSMYSGSDRYTAGDETHPSKDEL